MIVINSLLLLLLGMCLVLLNVLDLKLTWMGVKKLGVAKEVNPITRFILGLGYKPALAVKVIVPGIAAIMLISNGNLFGLLVGNLMFAGICSWNYKVLKRKLNAQKKS